MITSEIIFFYYIYVYIKFRENYQHVSNHAKHVLIHVTFRLYMCLVWRREELMLTELSLTELILFKSEFNIIDLYLDI
jgi:hypothetical protein